MNYNHQIQTLILPHTITISQGLASHISQPFLLSSFSMDSPIGAPLRLQRELSLRHAVVAFPKVLLKLLRDQKSDSWGEGEVRPLSVGFFSSLNLGGIYCIPCQMKNGSQIYNLHLCLVLK